MRTLIPTFKLQFFNLSELKKKLIKNITTWLFFNHYVLSIFGKLILKYQNSRRFINKTYIEIGGASIQVGINYFDKFIVLNYNDWKLEMDTTYIPIGTFIELVYSLIKICCKYCNIVIDRSLAFFVI